MTTKHENKHQKWKATLFLLCGVLWIFVSELAFGSPYVSRSHGEAFQHEIVLMNISLLLNLVAFWSSLFVLMCVWLCSAGVSRIVLPVWWTLVLLAQSGWVYLSLR